MQRYGSAQKSLWFAEQAEFNIDLLQQVGTISEEEIKLGAKGGGASNGGGGGGHNKNNGLQTLEEQSSLKTSLSGSLSATSKQPVTRSQSGLQGAASRVFRRSNTVGHAPNHTHITPVKVDGMSMSYRGIPVAR
jgi:hypothetical protein